MARSKYTKHKFTVDDPDTDSVESSADDFVSRSAKKRESDAMKALGMELAELSPRQLQELNLGEALYKAITDYQRITSNSAKRRQRGFVGGLLRNDLAEAQAIKERYAALTQHDADAKRVHHELEDWRERLIASDDALTEFLHKYATSVEHRPDRTMDEQAVIPAQELRTMIRRVRSARDDAQRKKATRVLYRKLSSIAQA